MHTEPTTADVTAETPLLVSREGEPFARIAEVGDRTVVTMYPRPAHLQAELVFEGPDGVILAEMPVSSLALAGAQRLETLADRLEADAGHLLDELLDALSDLEAITPDPSQLPEHDAQLLAEGGFTEVPGAYRRAITRSTAAAAQLRVTAASSAQVTAALDVTSARVRQLRGERKLWAIRSGNDVWVFPILQFYDDPRAGNVRTKQVQGLATIFQALPEDLHPLAVQGFLQTPQPDLLLGETPTTPLDWLRGGGDPAAVLRMVRALECAAQ